MDNHVSGGINITVTTSLKASQICNTVNNHVSGGINITVTTSLKASQICNTVNNHVSGGITTSYYTNTTVMMQKNGSVMFCPSCFSQSTSSCRYRRQKPLQVSMTIWHLGLRMGYSSVCCYPASALGFCSRQVCIRNGSLYSRHVFLLVLVEEGYVSSQRATGTVGSCFDCSQMCSSRNRLVYLEVVCLAS